MDPILDQLEQQAYLFDDPGTYLAGVWAAVDALRDGGALREPPDAGVRGATGDLPG